MTYKSLVREKISSLSLLLVYLTFYSSLRVYYFYQSGDYDWALYCIITLGFLLYGLFSKTYFAWRLSLIFVAAGFFLWTILLPFNNFSWDEFLTDGFLSLTLFLMATLVDDPRAIRKLKSAVESIDIA